MAAAKAASLRCVPYSAIVQPASRTSDPRRMNRPENTVVPTIDAMTRNALRPSTVSGTRGTRPRRMSAGGGATNRRFTRKQADITATIAASACWNTFVRPFRKSRYTTVMKNTAKPTGGIRIPRMLPDHSDETSDRMPMTPMTLPQTCAVSATMKKYPTAGCMWRRKAARAVSPVTSVNRPNRSMR